MSENEDTVAVPKIRRSNHRWSDRPKLAPDAASRQGQVTKLAFEAFGDKDPAIAYLNMDSQALGGRPLDIATESAEGLKRVERDIAAHKSGMSQTGADT